MKTKYSKNIPTPYAKCKKHFGVNWDKGIIITYGDTVYSKYGEKLSDDLKVHESVHVRQQTEMEKDIWWERYFNDSGFRLSQEVEAYKAQVKYAKENYTKKHYEWLLEKIVYDMATIYGKMCTREEARKLII